MASLTGQSIASSYKDLLQVSNSNSGIDGTARVVSDGEDTASKLFLDTNRVGVGIAPTDGTLHVHTATAGSITADGAADDLVVENSGAGGITILTPNDALGQLAFGSPADAYGAFIGWKSDDNQMTIATANDGDSIVLQTANKATALTIDSSQNVGIGATKKLFFDGGNNTYLSETSGDILKVYANNAICGTFRDGGFAVEATGKLWFDGAGDTYIHEQSADKLDFFVGNGTRFVLDTNSRISLSNNDSGGTGGRDSTSSNTLFGWNAGTNIASGSVVNTFIGHASGSGSLDSAQNNVGVGAETLQGLTTGDSNTVMGAYSAFTLTTGQDNVIIGADTGFLATTQNDLVLIGRSAGDAINNDGANGTVAIGRDSLTALTSGGKNVAIGYKAGEFYNGSNSTIIGYEAGLDADGGATDSTLIGMEAGKHLDDATYNTAIGIEAMKSNSGGSNTAIRNTAIGWRAGDLIRTGSDNVVIGHGAEVSATDAVNQIAIGKETQGVANNSVTLGNSEVTDVYMAQDSGATVHADYVLSQGNQNHVANTMSSPYYRFAGDDYIDTGQAFQTTLRNAFSISMMFCLDDAGGSTTYQCLMGARNSSEEDWIQIDIYQNTIRFVYVSDNDTVISTSASGLIPTGRTGWQHLVCTADGTNMITYLNGVNVKSTSMTSVTMSDYTSSDEIFIGGRDNNGSLQLPILNGDIQRFAVHNHALTATEVKELYSGASIPYKYKGANQTDLVETHDAGSGTAWTGATGTTPPDGWSAQGSNRTYTIDSGSGSGSEPALQIGSGAAGNAGIIWGGTASLGKRYRATFSYKNDASTVVRTVTNEGTTTLADSTSWTHNQTIEWTGDGASGDFAFTVVTANKNAYIDNVVIQQIGAVAEYDGSGIASDKWNDKSGNDLHGTVSGATVENAPSGDDGLVYEEGTWDAGLSFGSGSASLNSSYNTGKYVRVGNVVHVQGYFALSSISSPSGDTLITGLPFTNPDHAEGQEFSAVSIRMTDLASAINGFPQGFISSNATTIFLEKFQEDGTNAGTSRELGTHIGASTTIIINATYQI